MNVSRRMPRCTNRRAVIDSSDSSDSADSADCTVDDGSSIGSFVTSDDDMSATSADIQEYIGELRRLREARSDISELSAEYLWGMPQMRVHDRVLSKITAAAGPEWSPRFMGIVRSSPTLAIDDIPGGGFRAECAACNKPRWLSKRVAIGHRMLPVGRICAARLVVAHTLAHVQRTCSVFLDEMPIAHIRRVERNAVAAFDRVLDAADTSATLSDYSGDDADTIVENVMGLRGELGFAV